MPPPVEYAPPPMTRLETMVLAADIPLDLGIDDACDRVRAWLRSEIDRRLRETVTPEPVELACPDCGEVVDVSASSAEKVSSGHARPPRCFECARPARAAEAQAEAIQFVELLGDSAEELARAVAALS